MAELKHVKHFGILMTIICCNGASSVGWGNLWKGGRFWYQCHCTNNDCDSEGECRGFSTCKDGWFGPACQYVDLVQTNATTILPRTINGCQNGTGTDTINISFTDVFYFTWLRLRLSSPGISLNYTVQLSKSDNNSYTSCANMTPVLANETLVDIHCDPGVKFKLLTISGTGIKYLCSLYVSGGRNVALNQSTNQTSTFENNTSDRAVDGNINNTLELGQSCSHTDYQNQTTWTLSFSQKHRVSRYVIYNRNKNEDRLNGFELRALQKDNTTAFAYNNTQINQSIYYFSSETPNIGIFTVTIAGGAYLAMCEVEMYGDTVCDTGKYGRECENFCNCDTEDNCFVSTGGCPSGCAVGYQGENCMMLCNSTYYGNYCAHKCSTTCTDQLCNATDGTCGMCVPGKEGPMCDKDCDSFFYGQNCTQNCSLSCLNQHCDASNGNCYSCIPGKQGIKCDTVCNATFYGIDCAHNCSPNCVNQHCDAVNGNCYSCVIGKQGSKCEKEHGPKSSVGAIVGPVVAVLVLAIIIVIAIIVRRKHFHKNKDDGSVTRHYFNEALEFTPDADDNHHLNKENNQTKHSVGNIKISHIQGFNKCTKFIAVQDQQEFVLEDFVRMLWEQKVEVVVMLTSPVGNEKLKCEQYWPDDGQMELGEILIEIETKDVYADYTIQKLKLRKKGEPVQNITNFHFTTWQYDKDLPSNAWVFYDFCWRVTKYQTNMPIVVHSSTGVGRTGTFIILHNILEEIKTTETVNVIATVKKFNKQRLLESQYDFLRGASKIALLCHGTFVTANYLLNSMQILEQVSPSGKTKLEEEFNSISMLCDNGEGCNNGEQEIDTFMSSREAIKKMKNRYHNILPKEPYRPILASPENNDRDTYINAVLVPKLRSHNGQILTQLPLPSTIADFWRLVTQFNVTLIVAFEKDLNSVNTDIGDYLSERDYVNTASSYKIGIQSCDLFPNWKIQRIVITQCNETSENNPANMIKAHIVSHISCNKTDMNSENLILLVKQIWKMTSVGEGRILYMCRDGATFSGPVFTLSLLLEHIDNNQEVSVPLVLGAVKSIRSQVIPTLEQYRLLYQTLINFVETSMYCTVDEL